MQIIQWMCMCWWTCRNLHPHNSSRDSENFGTVRLRHLQATVTCLRLPTSVWLVRWNMTTPCRNICAVWLFHLFFFIFSKAVRGDLLGSRLVLYSPPSDPEELARSRSVHTSGRPPCRCNSLSLCRKCLVFTETQGCIQSPVAGEITDSFHLKLLEGFLQPGWCECEASWGGESQWRDA